jgi:hypothetical protein
MSFAKVCLQFTIKILEHVTCVNFHYVRNSNRRHRSKTFAKVIVSDLKKQDTLALVRIRTDSVVGKRRWSSFWRVSVKLIPETCRFSDKRETLFARGTSPFIMKADAPLIPSPIMKARAFPFIMKTDASLILNIERHALQRNVSVLYAPYKARSQLVQNSGGARSTLFLLFLSFFRGAL